MTTSDPVLSVYNLTKKYGTHEILRGVDLQITPGETYALLGPNGAGKTTTIEILEGFRKPDSGEIRILGEDPLTAPRSWRSRVGIVAQQTGDLGPYTPREMLRHFSGLYPNPRDPEETLELVGLTEQGGVRASKLSGGQQRRLDVALGIIGHPEMLFLDEPTTGFDPEARRQFWDMLITLKGSGTAILLTTHYLEEAAQLADRVGVISGGKIVAEGPPDELGGSAARVPVVYWNDANGTRHAERTETPAHLVAELVEAADGSEPRNLEVRRPSLEEVYLELIAAEGTHS